jgi:hypothetical protein
VFDARSVILQSNVRLDHGEPPLWNPYGLAPISGLTCILMRLKVTQFLVNHSLEAKNLPYDFLASKHLGGSTSV